MGVQRGDFEKVVAVQQGPRAAQISTDVADVGAPLRLLAPALKSWANVWGQLASMGTDYTRRKNNAEREMYETRADSASADAALKDVESRGRQFENLTRRGYAMNAAESKEYAAWQQEMAAAQENANRMRARSNMARQRWSKTGFFGWKGTPSPARGGLGLD